MKMRVLYSTSKGRVITFANAISESQKCEKPVDTIPPAYSCDRERLVILVLSLGNDVSDNVVRFCRELTKDRTQNVALVVDGKKDAAGIKIVKDAIEEAGNKVVGETYFVNGGLPFKFIKNIKMEERQGIVKWAEDIVKSIQS